MDESTTPSKEEYTETITSFGLLREYRNEHNELTRIACHDASGKLRQDILFTAGFVSRVIEHAHQDGKTQLEFYPTELFSSSEKKLLRR